MIEAYFDEINLSRNYSSGDLSAGNQLYRNYSSYFDKLLGWIEWPGKDGGDKRDLVKRVFSHAAGHYRAKNNASFETYISACIENELRRLGGSIIWPEKEKRTVQPLDETVRNRESR